MAVARDNEHIAFALDAALGQRHGFSGCGGFIKHGRIGDRHAGQVADHGLEIDQRLHAALRNLGLVGRVGGIPSGVFQHVAQNHARRIGAVITLANKAFEHLVLGSHCLELLERGRFRDGRRNCHGAAAGNRLRNYAVNQRPARGRSDDAEHVGFVSLVNANMAGNEFGRIFKLAQRLGRVQQHVRIPCQSLMKNSGGGRKRGVAGFIHQRIELRRVRQLDLEKPAGAQRVAVGQ